MKMDKIFRSYTRKNIFVASYFSLLWMVVIYVHIKLLPYAFDDAYIHFRIAENFIISGAPYFNIGENVLATSSFVWTLLLSVIFRIFQENIVVVSVLNSFLLVAGAYIWCKILSLLRNDNSISPYEIIFTLIYIGILGYSSVGLMETPLAFIILGLGIVFLLRGKLRTGFFFLALAVFVRLELIVFFLIYLFYHAVSNYRQIKKIIVGSILGIVPIAGLEYFYFGTLIPHTATAKTIVYQLGFHEVSVELLKSLYKGKAYLVVLVAITLMCVYHLYQITKKNCINTNVITAYLIGSAGVLIVFAYLIQKVFLHPWYAPIYITPILLFAYYLPSKQLLLLNFITIVLSLVPISNFYNLLYSGVIDVKNYKYIASEARVNQYKFIGNSLYEIAPNAVLLSSEIGGLGWGFKGEVIDAVGLVSPEALKYHPMLVPEQRSNPGIGAIPKGFVEEKLPDFIVSLEIFIEELKKSKIIENYHLLKLPVYTETDRRIVKRDMLWGGRYIFVYVRDKVHYDHLVKTLGKFPNVMTISNASL
jgi:hypothetical protein